MFRMIIESDHEKLKREGRYDPSKFDLELRKICLETHFEETSPSHYVLGSEYDEIGRMMVLNARLETAGCVLSNLKTWVTFSDDEGEVNWLND